MEETTSAIFLALSTFGDPIKLALLLVGVVCGLVIGILPGLGGIIGLTLFLPLTFHMEPAIALSMLIGLHAVVATSDSIPAILFGVPGTVGSAATVLDGFPMAKRGEAGRALSAAFLSSLFGGLFGALALAVAIPFIRPLILSIGSPEMLALCLFGLSLVAVLSGRSKAGGFLAVSLGLLLAMVGEDYQSGKLRWTFDTIYLWSGIPLVPLALGLFAFPEIADLVVRRTSIAGNATNVINGWRLGSRDVVSNAPVLVRSSVLGSLLGALPGIGSAVIDWVAYGSTVRRAKDDTQFGKGDVRGVIASEASNNAKEGGALVPTLAFGVPGSAGMAILLGAFSIHGIVPGPSMLDANLHITYSLIFSLVLANVMAAGLCFLFARKLASVALIPIGFMAPIVISVVVLGALQAENHWADLGVFFTFGLLGLVMRILGWPRPPLLLGFVLGPLVERYLATSYNIYGLEFLLRPLFLLIAAFVVWSVLSPVIRKWIRRDTPTNKVGRDSSPVSNPLAPAVAGLAASAFFAVCLVSTLDWNSAAAAAPRTIAILGLLSGIAIAAGRLLGRGTGPSSDDGFAGDLPGDRHELSQREARIRLLSYCGWTLFCLPMAFLFGPVPGVASWCFVYMRAGFGVSWLSSAITATSLGVLAYVLFDRILNVIWPASLLMQFI